MCLRIALGHNFCSQQNFYPQWVGMNPHLHTHCLDMQMSSRVVYKFSAENNKPLYNATHHQTDMKLGK